MIFNPECLLPDSKIGAILKAILLLKAKRAFDNQSLIPK